MRGCPCVSCPSKGCGSYHDQCSKYQDYRKLCESIKAKRRKDVLIRDDSYYRCESVQRYVDNGGVVVKRHAD